MITSDTLTLKLTLQSKLLAKSLNLPESFGYDLLATSVYQHILRPFAHVDWLVNAL